MNSRVRTAVAVSGFLLHFVLFSWCDIYGWWWSSGDFTPFSASPHVSALTYDESQLYLPGPMQFARRGTLHPEVDVTEFAAFPNGYPILHSVVIGGLAKACGDIEAAWIIAHGLFPALLWLLVYLMLSQGRFTYALPAALATMAVLLPQGPRNMLLVGGEALYQPLEITRTPHPSLSYTLLLTFALALTAALRQGKPRMLALAGIAFASLFYSYYFMWVAAGIAVLLLILLFIAGREKTALWRLLAISVAGGSLAVPYLLQAIAGLPATTELGGARHLMERVGSFERTPDVTYLIFGVVGVALLGVAWSRRTRRGSTTGCEAASTYDALPWVLGALVVAGICGFNFHLLTGYNAQHDHFANRLIQPTAFIFVCVICCRWLARRFPEGDPSWIRWFSVAALTGWVVLAGARQTIVAINIAHERIASSPRNEVLYWLRNHVHPDTVVGSIDEELLTLLPGVAGTWNFVPLGDRSMASTKEILLRYCVVSRLLGLPHDEVTARLKADSPLPHKLISTAYILVMQHPLQPKFIGIVDQLYPSLDIVASLETRRLDLVIAANRDCNQIASDPRFAEIHRNTDWTVYRRR